MHGIGWFRIRRGMGQGNKLKNCPSQSMRQAVDGLGYGNYFVIRKLMRAL